MSQSRTRRPFVLHGLQAPRTAGQLLSPEALTKLLRFHSREMQRFARSLLVLCDSAEIAKRPSAPERLGNLLQHLALAQPAQARVVEDLVAELLRQLES